VDRREWGAITVAGIFDAGCSYLMWALLSYVGIVVAIGITVVSGLVLYFFFLKGSKPPPEKPVSLPPPSLKDLPPATATLYGTEDADVTVHSSRERQLIDIGGKGTKANLFEQEAEKVPSEESGRDGENTTEES
jgi:hypothetical protein